MTYNPIATYRIQFNKSFTFNDLKRIIPYLDILGIRTIYASPIFEAMPGSVHGYDGVNANKINPEIGTYKELQAIAAELKSRKMGWIQDFVPNHMAYSARNAWLYDVLEKGKMSVHEGYFDMVPTQPLMAPFLGTSLDTAVDEGQVKLVQEAGQVKVAFAAEAFPLNLQGYLHLFSHELVQDGERQIKALEKIAAITDKAAYNEAWQRFMDETGGTDLLPGEKLEQLNKDKAFIKQLLNDQFYRLCDWRETNHAINYRRFFTVNGLICLNMQRRQVFNDYHRLLAQLVEEGIFQGVRIDHIDGLYDPGQYLHDLRNLLGEDTYIVVEKILGKDEAIPESWAVQGTTGYDFLAQVNKVLSHKEGIKVLTQFYDEIATQENSHMELVERYKDNYLRSYMQGELDNLLLQFRSVFRDDGSEGITDGSIRALIAELLVCCPVYRFYIDALPFSENIQHQLDALLDAIEQKGNVSPVALDFFKRHFVDGAATEKGERQQAILDFWRRCMQFSGPLMAKGVEDTLAYNYNAFLANNEVGNDIISYGISTRQFHELMQDRSIRSPLAMNATATHDTKRGEDSRSRLQYLSLVPYAWLEKLQDGLAAGGNDLSKEDKYFILQVIYSSLDEKGDPDDYKERFKAFAIKAAREAGRSSSWHENNETYEARLTDFGLSLLEPDNSVGKEIRHFIQEHKQHIARRALVQLILKYTCPGVPDTYQGTELWDLSFVDPDNRRAVDYDERMAMLQDITAPSLNATTFQNDLTAPSVKLFVLHRLLQLRKAHAALFESGSYQPLRVSDDFLAFARSYDKEHLIVVLPLKDNTSDNTMFRLPAEISGKLKNIFTGELTDANQLDIQAQLKQFPVLALLSQNEPRQRKGGILLPLFSLASDFGIGGMGSEAYDFMTLLSNARQQLWQLLPHNPVQESNEYSPYASISAFAGEPMLIDPVLLREDGLLGEKDMKTVKAKHHSKIAYTKVRKAKGALLAKAWATFREGRYTAMEMDFEAFREAEKEWLDDYALFVIISSQYDHAPWFEWPEPLRKREPKAMEEVRAAHEDALLLEQWKQFLFFRQWKDIREAARKQGLMLVGDIPFYLSHNSVDVWANQGLFSVDEAGRMTQSAGVPPDYFSEKGQLWLMPTYNWVAAKENGFAWWIRRLKQNVKLFDIVRLDHFRAFYDYWEVPADHEDAVQGRWKAGPKDELFGLIQQHFPDMPFIAEDLGEVHQGVFDLRDRYGLKGMRILQFGFDPFDASLRDLPHNFDTNTVVYTGTHDNNTTLGWYQDLSDKSKKALNRYMGHKVNEKNVNDMLVKAAYQSIAAWSIIPAQDMLHLDASARLNTPGTAKHNWLWRLQPGELTEQHLADLKQWTELYNR